MKQLYMFKSLLIACIMMLFGGGNFAFAQETETVTIWSEDWTGYANGQTPSSGNSAYSQGNSGTKMYNEKLAGGTAPELLLKANDTWTVTLTDLKGCTGELTLTYMSNKSTLKVKANGTSVTMSNSSSTNYAGTIQIGSDVESLVITFTNTTNARIDNIVLTGTKSSAPAITASDVVEYAADILKGEIPYTISNPVEGTSLAATTSTEWISEVTVGESAVTFTMEENTGAERTGTITLSYGELTKDITVKQSAAVAKRTVTIETPANGTLKVFRGTEEVVSGAQIPEGTVLTIEATPAEGYKFRNWQAVVDGTTHTYPKATTYTIGTSDVTFKANFDAIVYNTITWSINGVETTAKVETGTDITFPEQPKTVNGYEFVGWSATTCEPSDMAPELVASATATADVTYYAVFAKASGSSATVELNTNGISTANNGYANHTYEDTGKNEWTSYSNEDKSNGVVRFGLNPSKKETGTNNPSYFKSPIFSGNITKIRINGYNGSATKDRYFYIDAEPTSSTHLGEVQIPGGDNLSVVRDVTFSTTDSFNQFYLHASEALGFNKLEVTYGSKTYSDYTTSIPTTGTFTFTAQDAEGNYYATFSCDKKVVFPEGVDVSVVVGVTDGKLTFKTDKPEIWTAIDGDKKGTFVDKNQGVLLKSREKTVTYYYATIPSGNIDMNNIFIPVTNEDGTFEGREGYKYYKLAYDNYDDKTGLGFYWGAENGAPFKSKKGLAVLEVPETTTSGAAPTHFLIGGGTDGISNVKSDVTADKDGVIYNIAGQRVNAATKPGLYIIGGKKVVVK